MFPSPDNYEIYPSIVEANKPSEMTIVPTERSFLLFDGEYSVTIISTDADEISYFHPQTYRNISAIAKDGYLRFTFTFEEEQEHIVILKRGDSIVREFRVFSLLPDLYGKLALKGDLHAHSYRSDGRQDPAALAGHFREQGYDFFALTDHNRHYPGYEIDETYKGVDLDFTKIFGEEVHCPGSMVHIVHVGGNKSVTDRYVNHKEEYDLEIAEYLKNVPDSIPEIYRERYGMAMWATDKIHEAGGLAIFPHPFWIPGNSRIRNVKYELANILLKSLAFDAYEIVGAMDQPNCNRSVALWNDLRAEGYKINVVGSSDVHALEKSFSFPHKFTICFAEDNAEEPICNAIKNGLSVAIEATGTEYDRHFRAYGSYRLVNYAQFLLSNYFPKLQRIAEGQGVAMRNYAMGKVPAALVELHADMVRKFRLSFFGKKAPMLPSMEIIDFENKARERHLQSPTTKGSLIDPTVLNRQI